MVTLLPRVLGAIATSVVAWIALTLETPNARSTRHE